MIEVDPVRLETLFNGIQTTRRMLEGIEKLMLDCFPTLAEMEPVKKVAHPLKAKPTT